MKAIKLLLIIGMCVGLTLEAGDCPCKNKVTKEQRREKKEKHKEAEKILKQGIRDLERCHCAGVFQTIPADKVLVDNGKIKRDHNGDRI